MIVNESNMTEQPLQPNTSDMNSNVPKFSVGDRVIVINLTMPGEIFYVQEVVRNTIPVSYVVRGENSDTRVYSEMELLEYGHTSENIENNLLDLIDCSQFTENILQEIKNNKNYVPIREAVLKFQNQFPQITSSVSSIKLYLHNNYKSELDIRKVRSRYMVNKELLDTIVFDLDNFKATHKKTLE